VFFITSIAGTGTSSYSGDNGAATSASMMFPTLIALDSSGTYLLTSIAVLWYSLSLPLLDNVYISDSDGHRIRKITVLTGIITTIAGTGTGTYSGDNGQATSAAINYPFGVALDASGNYHSTTLYSTATLLIL